jgi:tetratricopeptide (TPR) repeat protein
MPMPRDRSSLLRLAADTQRALDDTADGDSPERARELFRLGEIRFRLGETSEAERLFDESATVSLRLPSPAHREWAAVARLGQSKVPMAEGRFDEALVVIERTIEEPGLPESEPLRETRRLLLDGWIFLLEQVEDYERLYTAADIALDLLDPGGPEKERLTIAKALAWRADAVRALGRGEEAVDLYEKAITQFKAVDRGLGGRQLIETTAKLTEVQTELGLLKESLTAFGQMISTASTTLPRLAMSRLRRPKGKTGQ